MIDIENKVFSNVANAVKARFAKDYPGVICYSEYVEAPESFPCISLIEEDNYTLAFMQDESLHEHYAVIRYVVNVFTNNASGKKMLAKKIADVVDFAMQDMKFTRIMRSQMPNVDRTIYRLTMRYEAIVGAGVPGATDKDGYPTVTHQMYRR